MSGSVSEQEHDYEHHQQSHPNIPIHNDTSHFYSSSNPGTINIAFGSAMMGSMLIFFLWMCYFCRCKDPKPEDESSTVSNSPPYPYWIDIPEDNDTEDHVTICDDNEIYESLRSQLSAREERIPTPPPTYETLFNSPPTYEDVMKEPASCSLMKKSSPKLGVYVIR